MSIRVTLLLLVVAFFSAYAWRNWFVSLCGAVLLMAVVQHPDFPNRLLGIQGLNPWNILFLNVFLSWLAHRREQGFEWDPPGFFSRSLVLIGGVILVGFLRLAMDPAYLEDYTFFSGFSEYFVNNVKWLMVGVIFYDTCRTRRRVEIALICVLSIYFLLAVQVIRWVPIGAAISGGDEFSHIAYKMTQNEIGYNRVTLSMMLGGATWAIVAFLPLCSSRATRLFVLLAAGVTFLGQALTGGRTGYVAWAAVGLFLCLARWRRFLPLLPVGAAVVLSLLPGVRERLLMGFGGTAGSIVIEADDSLVTSGRTIIWPHVIRKISEAPLIGYGREAMQRTGLTDWLSQELEENFAHPHNAYLEQLLDNGIIGFLAVVPFFFISLWQAWRLFVDRSDPLFGAVGGAVCALILALLIGAMGGQTFYPREGAVGLWAGIGVMIRVLVERSRSLEFGSPLFEGDEPASDQSATFDPSEEEILAA